MRNIVNLDSLKYKLSHIPLQELYNHKVVSFGSIQVLQSILKGYIIIINRFYKKDNEKWSSISGIGLKELDDHMDILVNASDPDFQSVNYNDCHNYLSSSIDEAISIHKI